MPWRKSDYPSDWNERRGRVQSRSGDKCEECGVPNRAIGYRDKIGAWHQLADCRANLGMEADAAMLDGEKVTEIVCTTAHLDRSGAPGTPEGDGPLDCPDDRLKFLCQKCHLTLDLPRHIAKRAQTRLATMAAGSLFD